MRFCLCFLAFASFVASGLRAQCVNFPSSYIPLASISYVTAANPAGDHLVVGSLTGGAGGISNLLAQLPLPASTNQTFCDTQVQLAPQQFYSNVYVPDAMERAGVFTSFAGLLLNPANNQPYPNGVIPAAQVGTVYAFRIGAAQVTSAIQGWSPTGSMNQPRALHVAVMLPSGKVLVASPPNNAELYDPATGRFAPAGQMQFNHGSTPVASLLNDGRVLIVGGQNQPGVAELYDPATNQFVATGSPLLLHSFYPTATTLNDGRVLVVGGSAAATGSFAPTNSGAEVYDPKSGTFSRVGAMALNRNSHTATLMQDGRVLITGGVTNGYQEDGSLIQTTDTAEIFDPSKISFSMTGGMYAPRFGHFAVLLADATVLVGGGGGSQGAPYSADLYDPTKGVFLPTGSMNTAFGRGGASLLSNGQVLVTAGYADLFPAGTNVAQLYNPALGSFTPTGSMSVPRGNQTQTTLLDGRVLVTGGVSVCCQINLSSAEIYTPVTEGLVTSQTGLTFRAAQGSASVPPQTVTVLSATDTISWTASVKTYSGGNWLTASPLSGTSGPTDPSVALSIATNPTGLAAQDYFGAVTLTPTDGTHPPVSIAVVLSIVPAGTLAPLQVLPTGLVFLGTAGSSPKPQSFVISNFTSTPVNFTASASGSWFTFAPASGTITKVIPATITVTPVSSPLKAGVYRGSITLNFSDSTSQTVDLLLVVSAAPGSSSNLPANPRARAAAATCTPSKLLPVLTSIGTGGIVPAAFPASIIVQLQDDCGTQMNAGSVITSFTNGDQSIPLLAIGNGVWSATWTPIRSSAGATVRVDAQTVQPPLAGTVQVSVQVLLNPNVPAIASGGVLSSGDYISSPAQGLLVSIFGNSLADGSLGNASLPLPEQLGSTRVFISGLELPLLYVSPSQVNVLIPYEIAANASQQLMLLRGTASSVPIKIAVFDNQPAILSTTGNGAGQGHIYRVDASGAQILADSSAPAKVGDVLVVYAVGLGEVTPPIKSGDPAPAASLEPVTGTAGVTIGNVPAQVNFAGLTPTYSGLYQLNVVVPAGVAPGNQVPVTVFVNGRASAGNIFMSVGH